MWWFGGVRGFVFTEVRGGISRRGTEIFLKEGHGDFILKEGDGWLKRNVVVWRGVGLCFHGGARRSFTEGHGDFILKEGDGCLKMKGGDLEGCEALFTRRGT